MSQYDSRFFLQSDERMETVLFPLPDLWWSRFYEYSWASRFIESDLTVLDAACGVSHPFKFYLAEQCQAVYGCDVDERILSIAEIVAEIKEVFGADAATSMRPGVFARLQLDHANLVELPYDQQQFDRIFCISVLEHLDQTSMFRAFAEFARVLADDGLLIVTFDYPNIQFPVLEQAIAQAGLTFYDDVSFALPANALSTNIYQPTLYCFRAVLKKG